MNIDSYNFRGTSGKGLTFYSEIFDSSSGWGSDGLLNIELNSSGYEEIYMRFYQILRLVIMLINGREMLLR